jgi:hypothetical protein
LDADNFEAEGLLDKIKKERGYTYEDNITCTPEKLPNYEEKVLNAMHNVMHENQKYKKVYTWGPKPSPSPGSYSPPCLNMSYAVFIKKSSFYNDLPLKYSYENHYIHVHHHSKLTGSLTRGSTIGFSGCGIGFILKVWI